MANYIVTKTVQSSITREFDVTAENAAEARRQIESGSISDDKGRVTADTSSASYQPRLVRAGQPNRQQVAPAVSASAVAAHLDANAS